jgi:hypothetical protein
MAMVCGSVQSDHKNLGHEIDHGDSEKPSKLANVRNELSSVRAFTSKALSLIPIL